MSNAGVQQGLARCAAAAATPLAFHASAAWIFGPALTALTYASAEPRPLPSPLAIWLMTVSRLATCATAGKAKATSAWHVSNASLT